MKALSTLLWCMAFHLVGHGQYTYFNLLQGEEGDNASQAASNCEVIGDTIYTWGVSYDGDSIRYDLRKYDSEGTQWAENLFTLPDEFLYIGQTNSMRRIPGTSNFLISHGIVNEFGTQGFLMEANNDLDTLWTKRISLFPDYTYFTTHVAVSDGFMVAGDSDNTPGQRGTFIAKVDVLGEYVWHQVLHDPEEGVFRNRDISVIDGGYVVSGGSGAGIVSEGRIELLNDSGIIVSANEWEEEAIIRGVMRHTVFSSGEILVTQGIGYQDYIGSTDPSLYYSKMNLYRLDTTTQELEFLGEYFDDESWVSGGVAKTLESVDDSKVMVGSTYKNEGGELYFVSFVFKLDSTYQMEWYTELTHDPCLSCVNELIDIERTSDGGYVMVGRFWNDDDPFTRTWLVKVDACGDLEWQGCEAVGVSEVERPSRLSVYPNPTQEVVNIQLPKELEGRITIDLVDLSGRIVLREEIEEVGYFAGMEYQIDLDRLGSGVYDLRLTWTEGILSSKVIVK